MRGAGDVEEGWNKVDCGEDGGAIDVILLL
jgi:hypothetical protein